MCFAFFFLVFFLPFFSFFFFFWYCNPLSFFFFTAVLLWEVTARLFLLLVVFHSEQAGRVLPLKTV